MKFDIQQRDLHDVTKGILSTTQDEAIVKLRDDGWLVKVVAPANDFMFACKVPESAMDAYSRGDLSKIGPRVGDIKNLVSKNSENNIRVELKDSKLRMKKANTVVDLPMTDTDLIDGAQDHTPDLEYAVTIEGDLTFLKDFVKKKADGVVGTDSMVVSARDKGIYLFAEEDGKEVLDRVMYDDLESVELNWGKGAYGDELPQAMPVSQASNPSEDHQVDTVISTDLIKSVHYPEDDGMMKIDNHFPVKYVFENDRGVMFSYFVFPRVTTNENVTRVPEDMIEDGFE